MDSAAIKLELMQQLLSISDEKTLRKVVNFFKKEVAVEEDEDFTAEEIAELDRRRARRLSGEGKGYTAEESIRMLREAQAKDEAA